jgi:formate C-acetyltransferase
MAFADQVKSLPQTQRVANLRQRVRAAMSQPPCTWDCPARIYEQYMHEPLPVRKAHAIALKLSKMPTDLWAGQLFAGSMTLESPRLHAERGFPDYTTAAEREQAAARGLGIGSVFGHIVPDYPSLLTKGLAGIRRDAQAQRLLADSPEQVAFLDSVTIALDAVMHFAARLADRCEQEARATEAGGIAPPSFVPSPMGATPAVFAGVPLPPGEMPGIPSERSEPRDDGHAGPRMMAGIGTSAAELRQMAANLRQAPAGPAQTFWQALQSVWLLHMVFHSTMNGNAVGRLDQYAWPYLEADLAAGRLTLPQAAELVDAFSLKFNERAKTTDEQRPDARHAETIDPAKRTRHGSSSQVGTDRDRVDATNHWLQNVIIGGLTPDGRDGTNPLTHLLLRSYRLNRMTNPLMTVRLHADSPQDLLDDACETLKDGGGMPAIFNDEAIVPALERIGIPTPDARDYTNDGCWEVIIPGRTDFRFQRISVMLPLEWALHRGCSRLDGSLQGIDTGDPLTFATYDDVWQAFLSQLDRLIERTVLHVIDTINDRGTIAPVPLLSALIDGAIASRRDMTAGGAKFRTFALLAEAAAHAIDSMAAIKTVIFEDKRATMADLCNALDADFEGFEPLRRALLDGPKYGNDDERADGVGRDLIEAFTTIVARHAEAFRDKILFPCGVGTFSWYIGIGEGLGASPDGRRRGQPVSSNFSPALGRDRDGIPAAILSYSKMHHANLPAGGPLDLRLAKRLVQGPEGTARMAGLLRGFVATGGAMMTLTVADTEELRAAQREPEQHESLRVRMGGWCAYFTMLSRQQQDHHIRRQEGRNG